MKNIARKLSALLLVFVVSAAALCPAFAAKADLPELPKDQYVVDEANVLSSSTEQTIIQLNNQLQANCKGATIGVLTVDYTGSCTTEEYALQAANAWGIGSSTGNNGVLILLVMETQQYADGDYYIATGDGFRNTTLESQASALAQTMEDDFVRQDYDDAVTTCARNVAQTIADIYGVSLSGGNTNNGSYNEPAYDDNSSGGLGDILLGFITILFTVVLLLIIVSVVVYTFSGPLSGLFWCFGGPWLGACGSCSACSWWTPRRWPCPSIPGPICCPWSLPPTWWGCCSSWAAGPSAPPTSSTSSRSPTSPSLSAR